METIEITCEEYEELLDEAKKLQALYDLGVDNWEFYDAAMEHYHHENN